MSEAAPLQGYAFTLSGEALIARGSGALYWPAQRTLCVSDLHLGKSERIARRGGSALPPYETQDTLQRLEEEIDALAPDQVICLGDSFDDAAAAGALDGPTLIWLQRLQAGREWIWIEGNHDPGPVGLGGTHLADMSKPPLSFRHIAQTTATGEISGHYHPKAAIKRTGGRARPSFLIDSARVIMPAFGTYTGGLHSHGSVLGSLMGRSAIAVLTGPVARAIPMPR